MPSKRKNREGRGPIAISSRFVKDRPGHDRRYAIDATKITTELGWKPNATFEEALRQTVRWYLDNRGWCQRIAHGVYRRERLGLKQT